MISIILFSFAKILLNSSTNLYNIILRDCDISSIKKGMHVLTKQKTIARCMRSILGEGFDMGGVQDGQSFFACDRTAPMVGLGDNHAKRTLP